MLEISASQKSSPTTFLTIWWGWSWWMMVSLKIENYLRWEKKGVVVYMVLWHWFCLCVSTYHPVHPYWPDRWLQCWWSNLDGNMKGTREIFVFVSWNSFSCCVEIFASQNVSESDPPWVQIVCGRWQYLLEKAQNCWKMRKLSTFQAEASNCHKLCKVWIPLKGRQKVKQLYFWWKGNHLYQLWNRHF